MSCEHNFDLDQRCGPGGRFRWGMTEENPKQTTKRLSHMAEMQRNLEDYANDLRTIIEKLHEKLKGLIGKH